MNAPLAQDGAYNCPRVNLCPPAAYGARLDLQASTQANAACAARVHFHREAAPTALSAMQVNLRLRLALHRVHNALAVTIVLLAPPHGLV